MADIFDQIAPDNAQPQQPQQPQGSPVQRFAKGVWDQTGGAAADGWMRLTGIGQLMEAAQLNAQGKRGEALAKVLEALTPAPQKLAEDLGSGMKQQAGKTYDSAVRGDKVGTVAHGIGTVLPMVGPSADAVDKIQAGDVAGGAGDIVGNLGGLVGGGLAASPRAVAAARSGARSAGQAVAGGASKVASAAQSVAERYPTATRFVTDAALDYVPGGHTGANVAKLGYNAVQSWRQRRTAAPQSPATPPPFPSEPPPLPAEPAAPVTLRTPEPPPAATRLRNPDYPVPEPGYPQESVPVQNEYPAGAWPPVYEPAAPWPANSLENIRPKVSPEKLSQTSATSAPEPPPDPAAPFDRAGAMKANAADPRRMMGDDAYQRALADLQRRRRVPGEMPAPMEEQALPEQLPVPQTKPVATPDSPSFAPSDIQEAARRIIERRAVTKDVKDAAKAAKERKTQPPAEPAPAPAAAPVPEPVAVAPEPVTLRNPEPVAPAPAPAEPPVTLRNPAVEEPPPARTQLEVVPPLAVDSPPMFGKNMGGFRFDPVRRTPEQARALAAENTRRILEQYPDLGAELSPAEKAFGVGQDAPAPNSKMMANRQAKADRFAVELQKKGVPAADVQALMEGDNFGGGVAENWWRQVAESIGEKIPSAETRQLVLERLQKVQASQAPGADPFARLRKPKAAEAPAAAAGPAPDVSARIAESLRNVKQKGLEQVLQESGVDRDTALAALFDLEMQGVVKQLPGKNFTLWEQSKPAPPAPAPEKLRSPAAEVKGSFPRDVVLISKPAEYLSKKTRTKAEVVKWGTLVSVESPDELVSSAYRNRVRFPVEVYDASQLRSSKRLPAPIKELSQAEYDALMKKFDEQDRGQ